MNKKLQKIKETTLKSIKRGGVIACLSITYAGGLFGQVTINFDEVWNGSIPPAYAAYQDGIIVGTGRTLTIINCDLEMNQNSEIRLYTGARLIIDNTTITSSDPINDVYWKGIFAQGDRPIIPGSQLPEQFSIFPDPSTTDDIQKWNGELNVCELCQDPFSTMSYVETRNNSEISHAKIGIESYWGAIIRSRETSFKNNETSIYIHDYISNLQPQVNASYFMNCSFEWTKNNPNFNQAALKGIYLHKVRGINIGGCTFTYNELDNSNDYIPYCINQRGTGIYANNGGFAASTAGDRFCYDDMMCLKNCEPGGLGAGCNFNNLSKGIEFFSAYSSLPVNFGVSNSTFNNNHVGISAIHTGKVFSTAKVFDNTFSSDRTVLNEIFEDIDDCYTNNYLIKDVTIHNMVLEAYRNNFSFIGDYVHHITSSSNMGRIMSNEFYNSNSATIAADNVFGVNVVGSNSQLVINCNTFTYMGTDIKINNGATVKNPMHGKNPSLTANNTFSDLLTGRYRIDNHSSNSTITYKFHTNDLLTSKNPNQSISSSNNVTDDDDEYDSDCGLECEELLFENGYGLDVAKIQFNNNLLVYPNPADRMLNIQISNSKYIQSVSVVNMHGAEVYTKLDLNEESLQVNTQNLANGIYLIQVLTTENELLTAKVIVNH